MRVCEAMRAKNENGRISRVGDEVRLMMTDSGISMRTFVEGQPNEAYRSTTLGDGIEFLPMMFQSPGVD